MIDSTSKTAEEQQTSELSLLRSLYPELNNDQLLEVKERLDGYFEVVLETFLEKYSKPRIDDTSRAS
jgi:hypothetical protein